MKETYPGSFFNLLYNILLLKNSYCGAWWFVQTYVILVLLSPVLFSIIEKYNSKVIIKISSIIYFIAYLQRIKNIMQINNEIVVFIVNAIVLVGTSQLSFVIGTIFLKEEIYSKLYTSCKYLKYKNAICIIGIIGLIVVHGFFESMFIDPAIGVIFICLFNLMKLDKFSLKLWHYFGKHSTNMWLTHMLFYMNFAEHFVFASRNVIMIFFTLIGLSLISSNIINLIYIPIIKFIDSKKSKLCRIA